jgi:hypothetical protein
MTMSTWWEQLLHKLLTQPTVSVPEAGLALAELKRNASYGAAANGTLGVPVLEVAGKKRVPSVAVLRKLGLASSQPPPEIEPASKAVPIPRAVHMPGGPKAAPRLGPIVKGRRGRLRKTAAAETTATTT